MPFEIRSRAPDEGLWIVFSDGITLTDLQRAFLHRVGEGGWDQPTCMDYSQVRNVNVTPGDIAELALFVHRHATTPRAARLAILVPDERSVALASVFKAMDGPQTRRHIKIVTTAAEARDWLDEREPPSEMVEARS